MISANKIIVGTANFFNSYGFDNSSSFDTSEMEKFFAICEDIGITKIDLAEGYDNLEKIIPILKNYSLECIIKFKIETENSIVKLSHKLKYITKKNININTLMIHNPNFLFFETCKKKSLLQKLMELKSENDIKNIGVSIYSPEELRLALLLKDFIKVFQLPICPGDGRWSEFNSQPLDNELEFHFRSIFLQGRIFSPPDQNYDLPDDIQKLCKEWFTFSRDKTAHAGAAAVNSVYENYNFGTHFVIGVETVKQLTELIENLDSSVLAFNFKTKSKYLDIRNWSKI